MIAKIKNKLNHVCNSNEVLLNIKSLIKKKLNYKLLQKVENGQQQRITKENATDFLNGFRGLCAFIIVAHHSNIYVLKKTANNTLMEHMNSPKNRLTNSMALPGFFLLSAFLLTYRLMAELIDETSSSSAFFSIINMLNIIKIFSKYFIRRFFRIYLVFVVYISIYKLFPIINDTTYTFDSWIYYVTVNFRFNDSNHI